MGITISTDSKGVRVYRNDRYERPSYAIRINKKEGDSWVSDFQQVYFAGGADIPNKTDIIIHEAFPTLSSWVKDGAQYTKIVWMIMRWEDVAGPHNAQSQKPVQSQMEAFDDLPDSFSAAEDEIPF